jgi:hypothetical protein
VGIRRSQGLDIVRAEQERQGAALTSAQLGVDYSTGAILQGQPPADWTGQYVHQVTVTYRTHDTEGNYELHTRTLGVKSTEALSPMAAVNSALDIMEEEPEAGKTPRLPTTAGVLTAQLSGVWYDTNRSARR